MIELILTRLIIAITLTLTFGADYGVDVSLPMHHMKVSDNYLELAWNVDPSIETPSDYQDKVVQPLGDRQKFYDDMIQGCVEYYGKKGNRCIEYERERVEMTLRQPQSMENYTDLGFKKIRAPDNVWQLIKKFWDINKDNQSRENWPAGNTYTNHWHAETRIVNIENNQLRGGGLKLKEAIWEAAQSTMTDWTNVELNGCSLYGIRVYTTGAVLNAHVDRLPLVSSAIINVAADVEEPWPLEVIGHDGVAYNVTMEPGEMVLYESHSVIHARPFPLKGNYVANIFVHFEPKEHSDRHNEKVGDTDLHEKYKKDSARGIGGHESDSLYDEDEDGAKEILGDLLPPYLLPGSPEVMNWISGNPDTKGAKFYRDNLREGTSSAHLLAGSGELEKLTDLIERHPNLITKADKNGWTPLHEGVRSGNVEVIRYLLSKGADVNHRTGVGFSALYLAHLTHGRDHEMSKFIESAGGEYIEPE
eukprot:CAMPEP_0194171908 /NCGR_PEP_ID=MMETSP0154-20130528/6470_1 /TAXON_ID=1049557 /ORGANISM="Thalassiothrix antarctica, Strain L6-D1" /LENGTH=474 /DNA_ID=CAMNT_0038884427 /DNA_START=169 /DNA_END=1590 /DNA_ORIENTATION=+